MRKGITSTTVLQISVFSLMIVASTFLWRISVDEPLQTVSPLPKRFIASGSFRCEQLFQIIRSNRPTTIAQTLQLVQSRYPSYFDNHAIAHNSLSLHEASFENPRAIVYGDDARTILTYNGDSTQGGYERLEVMCYNDAQDTFEFRDIAFPGEARSPEDLWDIPENQRNQPFVISPVNGGHPDLNCTMCHGDPPRPNWDTYNLWPGICSDHFPNAHINYSVVEERCRAFYDNRQNNPRYAVLGDRPMGSAFRLGQHLTHLNGERIARELQRRGNSVRSIRYQIAEAIYCDSVVPFNPADHGLSTNMDVTVLAEQPIPPRVREMLADNMRNYAHRLRRMEDIVGAENVDYSRTVAARNSREIDFLVRYYGINPRDHRERAGLLDAARIPSEPVALAKLEELLQPIGIDVRSWSMSLHGGYGHEGGTSSDDRRDPMPGIFGREFARLFLTDEPRLEEIYNELSTEGSYQRVSNAQARVLQQEMCNIVRPKAEQERRRGRVLPNQPEGTDDAVDN